MIHDNQIDLDLIGGAQAVWPDIAQLYMGGIRLSEDDFSAFGDLTIAGNTIVFHSYACGAALLPSMAFSDGAGVRLTRCAPQHQGPCYPTQCVPLAGESCIDHDITISGNQIVDDGVSPTSPGAPGPGIYVWLDDDSLDNLHIDQNVIRNAGWFVKNNPQSGWPPAAIWLYSFPPGGNQTDVGAFTGTVEVNCNDIIDQLSALSFGIEATDVVIPGAATAQGNMYTGANLIDDPLQKFSVSTLPCGLVP
jgi:hypothetical protein